MGGETKITINPKWTELEHFFKGLKSRLCKSADNQTRSDGSARHEEAGGTNCDPCGNRSDGGSDSYSGSDSKSGPRNEFCGGLVMDVGENRGAILVLIGFQIRRLPGKILVCSLSEIFSSPWAEAPERGHFTLNCSGFNNNYRGPAGAKYEWRWRRESRQGGKKRSPLGRVLGNEPVIKKILSSDCSFKLL